jgi:endonuclease/exonuclease/phosphatase family metal-dependent hydrolase
MPTIQDIPPEDVLAEIKQLRSALDQVIPRKILDYNLLISTWNIRAFGDLTEKWSSDPQDSPKRNLHALLCISELIARFDVVAIQEVKQNIKALRHLMKVLGPDWSMLLTDVNKGRAGNDERMAFLFDTRRVKLSGLASEVILPVNQNTELAETSYRRQFARAPYAVSFLTDKCTYILIALHVIYGENPAERVEELKAIAQWLANWARTENSWGHNLIALGDFNIDRNGDELYRAFTSTGLKTPSELDAVPRTLFSSPQNPQLDKHYDQIAWFTGENGMPMLSLRYEKRAGYFNFTQVVMPALDKEQLSWMISDHFPLWIEFLTREA